MPASNDNTTRFQLDPANLPALTPGEATRLEAIAIDYSDIPELPDDFWTRHPPAARERKRQITLRLDADVVEFFRAQGSGYQTQINAVLRTYVSAMCRRQGSRRRRRGRGADTKAANAASPGEGRRGRGHRGKTAS